ncbi:hypothetical protein EVA24_00170 [bacterium]|nr:MAG: hypothetical protein EVA24_00170 [bacterium]
MTPRLRNLLIGLGISVAIMIVDQGSKSSGSSNSNSARKAKIQKPKKVVAQNTNAKSNSLSSIKSQSKISNRRKSSLSSQLVGWQRNPFNSVAVSSEANIEGASVNTEKEKDIEKSILLKNLERYNVEIVAEFNNEKIVLIDSRRFRQGEYLNDDILIDRIENDQITFRNGSTTVTRNVGN